MELTRPFEKLNKNDANIAGGKGASLGEMTQAGIPVPPGFVVLADSFEQFIRETDLIQEIDSILDKVNHQEIHTVEAASEKIRALILNAEMPKDIAKDIEKEFKKLDTKYVAVRSSATAEDGMDNAWAGQLESYLNTKEEEVLGKVKLCWSSLFTPRAIFYRFEKGLHNTKISVAVVVQKMVESEVSGIAFSVHPVTEDRNQLIIEAGFGLGEAIVSGSITPDSYVVEKEPRNILDINVSTQDRALYRAEKTSAEHGNNEWRDIPEPKASSQVLTKEQILEFAEIVLGIEKHYGFPCDIEWAFEKGKFYIVQSRPITTLKNTNVTEISLSENKYSEYEPVFKFAGYNVFMTDLFFTAYRDLNPIVTIKDGNWVLWLSKDKQTDASRAGMDFALQDNFFNDFKNRSLISADRMLSLKEEKFEKMDNKDFVSFLDKLFDYAKTFVEDYKKTEFIFFTKLEKELSDSLGDDVHDFLSGKKNADNLLVETRKMLEYVINMQHLKLELRGKINEALIGESSLVGKVCGQLFVRTKRDDILSMTLAEIHDLLIGNKWIENVSERHVCSYITCDKDSLMIVSGEEAREKMGKLGDASSSDVVGIVANKGVVRGCVKVIPFSLNPEVYMDKMKKGDVLVSDTTGPDLMFAIKKAGAIVTDEGGLMSHAAVVAREFGIPCIVGTKYGTSVLKDGDMVEVDANKGVVKIIK